MCVVILTFTRTGKIVYDFGSTRKSRRKVKRRPFDYADVLSSDFGIFYC